MVPVFRVCIDCSALKRAQIESLPNTTCYIWSQNYVLSAKAEVANVCLVWQDWHSQQLNFFSDKGT